MRDQSPDRHGALLGIDGGRTKTVAVLERPDGHAVTTRGPGLQMMAAPRGAEQVRASLAQTLDGLTLDGLTPEGLGHAGPIDTACIGLNGVHPPSAHGDRVGEILRELTGARRLIVTSDVVTTFFGALESEVGAVVAGGTGAIALGVGPGGRAQRVDGWGYLLGDSGSGFEIGRRGLMSAVRALDGRDGSSLLAELAAERFGGPEGIGAAVYGSSAPARVVAGFCRDVADAARRGDGQAQVILRDAGRELGATLHAAFRRAECPADAPVSWAGGLFDAGGDLLDSFIAEVGARLPEARLMPPRGGSTDGALALARRRTPILESVSTWVGDW